MYTTFALRISCPETDHRAAARGDQRLARSSAHCCRIIGARRPGRWMRRVVASVVLAFSPVLWGAGAVIPPPPDIAGLAYLLIDAQSGKALVDHDSDLPLPPASLTKIMTSYIAAHELAAGRVDLDDQVPISVEAWCTPGSRTFIREGTTVRFEDLLRGMIIQSGNDATVAVAEHIAGTESAFVDMMNQHARRLGMDGTLFHNATGLPVDWRDKPSMIMHGCATSVAAAVWEMPDRDHQTSAQDLAKVTRAMIVEFPEHYAMYSERSFTFNNIDQPNRNRLLWRDRTVDGVKTGHTDAAGWCLISSAEREGMRLISVVMGASSDEARMRESNRLLSYGFRYYETQKLYAGQDRLQTTDVWFGNTDSVALTVADDVYVTIPRGSYDDLRAELDLMRIVRAPFEAGAELGTLRLVIGDEVIHQSPLIAMSAVEEAGLFRRLWQRIALFFMELFG